MFSTGFRIGGRHGIGQQEVRCPGDRVGREVEGGLGPRIVLMVPTLGSESIRGFCCSFSLMILCILEAQLCVFHLGYLWLSLWT